MAEELTNADVLGSSGILSRRLNGYRERPAQVAMANAVAEAIEGRYPLLVEAPTGVGKSFGYLVPALLHAVQRGRRVVVATHTIALQDQLLTKDLPFLDACLPVEFVARKGVGRSNYVSRRRLDVAVAAAPTLFGEDRDVRTLRRLEAWAETTQDGLRQELDQISPGVWETVQSESDNCLGKACATYETCAFHGARRRLFNADVIVTNHALYFTDLNLRSRDLSILPDHDVLILDEAHHLEDVVSQAFGLNISRRSLLHFLGRITTPPRDSGLVRLLPEGLRPDAIQRVKDLKIRTAMFFEEVLAWREVRSPSNGRVREANIVDDVLGAPLRELASTFELAAEQCASEAEAIEVLAAARRAAGAADEIAEFLDLSRSDHVHYIEVDGQGRDARLLARPLNVGAVLAESLFPSVPSVILTSATLATSPDAAGLAYTAQRLGCPQAKALVLESPFCFAERVCLHVPGPLPTPDDASFEDAAAAEISRYVRATRGGAFVLVTSYAMLNALHARCVGRMEREGYLVLRQGGALDRSRLLQAFRDDGNAVLFGADSFWEGVDVPGPALRLVILCRLPFAVPNTPLNEARAERARAKGQNPFSTLFLPDALLRFRQGFGRLIRTEEDQGLVVCLDRRLLEKSYGRKFLAALPPCPVLDGARENLLSPRGNDDTVG